MTKNVNKNKENESMDEIYAIETFNLTKRYKLKGTNKLLTALNNINLKINEGEIFGLLGPNGAGKTTLVSILTTLLQPSKGYAKIFGRNILKEKYFVKKNIGLMLGNEMIYYRLTGYRNLKFYCKIYNIPNYNQKIKEIAEVLDLTSKLNQLVETYSSGMKVKIALARILLINPKILFLDEPMLGLDPKIVKEIMEILINLKKTIFITSHQMNVVQALCGRIAFLKEGNIIKIDTQENFKKLVQNDLLIKVQMNDEEKIKEFTEQCSTLDQIKNIRILNKNIYFNLANQKDYPYLFSILKNYPIVSFNTIEPNLEDVFIKLSN